MENIFIHYGHTYFDDKLFQPIKNCNFVKPIGGLWASRIDASYGWKDWCNETEFRICMQTNSFKFKLTKNSKLLIINTLEELLKLPENKKILGHTNPGLYCLDFEKLKKSYDAIEVNISNDNRLYWYLYSWDCDSILILNSKCIETI